MAHNLFQDQMAYVAEPAWHRLGTEVPADVSARQMVVAANLDWRVAKVPAPGARRIDVERDDRRDQQYDGRMGSHPSHAAYDRYLIMRDPVGPEREPVALALVGKQYEPLQNADAFEFFDPFIRSGWASFHTAGALGDGERVWVLAKLVGQLTVGRDDPIDRYLLLSNSHDGSSAVSVRFTSIRVVCQNTLNLAQKSGRSVVSIRHTPSVRANLADAQMQKLRLVSEKVFANARFLFNQMAKRALRSPEVDAYLETLFPRTERQKAEAEEPIRWRRVRFLFDQHEPRRSAGTLWALYNAVTRDEDYRRPRSGITHDRRLARIWFGSGNDLKLRALKAARGLLN